MAEARDIFELALSNMVYIGPALLVLTALAVADQMVDFAINLIKQVRKEYKV